MSYFDTSVLVAYYCPEPLSGEAERAVRSSIQPVLSDLTEVEFASAVARKLRAKELRRHEAEAILNQFSAHLEANLYRRLALDRRHFRVARDFIARLSSPSSRSTRSISPSPLRKEWISSPLTRRSPIRRFVWVSGRRCCVRPDLACPPH